MTVLYDSGRLPAWFRLPCLLFALFCLGLTVDLLWLGLFGRTLLLPAPTALPLGWLSAAGATMLLAVWFAQLRVGRKRLLWDGTCRQLHIEDRWLFGTTRKRLLQSEVAAIRVQCGRVVTGRHWNIYAQAVSGRMTWLTQLATEAEARAVGERIAAALDRRLQTAD